MWARTHFLENPDSDQSISEEDEGFDGDCIENTVSLGQSSANSNKGGVQILSQLEKLTELSKCHPANAECVSTPKRKTGFHIDDEVEDPLFNYENASTSNLTTKSARRSHKRMFQLPAVASLSQSDEEIAYDEENVGHSVLECAEENVGGTWSEAFREVEALDWLHKNQACSSSHGHGAPLRENKSSKGGSKTKSKPKLLFNFQSRQKGFCNGNEKNSTEIYLVASKICAAVPEDTSKAVSQSELAFCEEDYEEIENIVSPSEEIPIENIVSPSEVTPNLGYKEHSMAEFLDCFHGRSALLQGNLEMDDNERERRALGKASPSGDGNVDNYDDDDDLPEAINIGFAIPSDDEEKPQIMRTEVSKSMADQFQEVMGTGSMFNEQPFALPISSCGLFGKLQQVTQREKERDVTYLKSLSASISSEDERMCISVKILSRSFEAKLTVCSCTRIGDGEDSYLKNRLEMTTGSAGRNSTIIFSPRICNDVELEVGNLIRVHPPWKEVQVKKEDAAIILCCYYSQIHS